MLFLLLFRVECITNHVWELLGARVKKRFVFSWILCGRGGRGGRSGATGLVGQGRAEQGGLDITKFQNTEPHPKIMCAATIVMRRSAMFS